MEQIQEIQFQQSKAAGSPTFQRIELQRYGLVNALAPKYYCPQFEQR